MREIERKKIKGQGSKKGRIQIIQREKSRIVDLEGAATSSDLILFAVPAELFRLIANIKVSWKNSWNGSWRIDSPKMTRSNSFCAALFPLLSLASSLLRKKARLQLSRDGLTSKALYCNLASWGVVWYGRPGKAAPAAVAAAAAAAGKPAAPGNVA